MPRDDPGPNVKVQRISSGYIHKLSGQLLISQESLQLLDCVGQGKISYISLPSIYELRAYITIAHLGEFGVVYKGFLNLPMRTTNTVAIKTLKGTSNSVLSYDLIMSIAY